MHLMLHSEPPPSSVRSFERLHRSSIDKFTGTFLRAFSIRAVITSMLGRRLYIRKPLFRDCSYHNRVSAHALAATQQTARRSITHQNVEVGVVETILASRLALQHEI